MLRDTPFPISKLVSFYKPENLLTEGGTIETALFVEAKLLEYAITFPKGFGFPPKLRDMLDENSETTFEMSHNHSGKNEIIFAGLSSNFYTKFLLCDDINEKIKSINTFRFRILLEQQSIISLVSVLETFIKSVQEEHNQNARMSHTFKDVTYVLKKCGIKRDGLEYLIDEKIYSRTREIINYAFDLRNLFVHNGGIIDRWFYARYPHKIHEDKIGKLIRIEYEDYNIIREWLSFFIQEVCRVIEGYNEVWTDYLLSTGIVLPDVNITLKSGDEEYVIPLEDGVELVGKYTDEIINQSGPEKSIQDIKTYGFQLDFEKVAERKQSQNKEGGIS